ncbi:MAG TPA: shikimate dehydrogenase [Puia sp.]|nr:shikimate dehydrogenase [Puia sp.]
MRVFGLIGYPLGHSFSEQYFASKFSREGINDAVYRNFSIATIDKLPSVLFENPGLVGLNVTIPHKRNVIPFLTISEELPIPACNCIRIQGKTLSGYNTDVIGFEKTLVPQLKAYHRNALILGTGGSSEAVQFVLQKLGINFILVSRDPSKKNSLPYSSLNKEMISENLLIINTTPIGMHPNVLESPAIPFEFIGTKHFVYDLIYNPSETSFLKGAKNQGATTKNGYDMLVAQAEESWRIWNS